MEIYNRTNQIQELSVYDRDSKRQFSIYIVANGTTTIDSHMSAPSLKKLIDLGVFMVVEEEDLSLKENLPEAPEKEDLIKESVEIIKDEEPEEGEVEETSEGVESIEAPPEEEVPPTSKFVCDICGGEFASSRGLASHKSRAHNS